jgi:tRNA-specific 2-thiouridylase
MSRERVVVAMSGGVDSSVAAALLVEQGFEVIGIMLRLWSEADQGRGPSNRCCALGAQYDAERVAQLLSIPFYVVNLSDAFKRRVVDYFEDEYAAGRTPNPCVECNRHIRFGHLLRRAKALGADYLATGHYARVEHADGAYQLLRGKDHHKDQSYVLHVLRQDQLAQVRFPIGHFAKAHVRKMALDRGLPVAMRPDSQDLCFIADGDYRRYLAQHRPDALRPGPIVRRSGDVLGQHVGLARYTIGQRKGIGVAAQQPLYVLAMDADTNALIVGTEDELGQAVCEAQGTNWISGSPPAQTFSATAKIRYKADDVPVEVDATGNDTVRVRFETALRDITPGQAVVFYHGERVLGGGMISTVGKLPRQACTDRATSGANT